MPVLCFCGRRASSHGLCGTHAWRKAHWGSVRKDVPIRPSVKEKMKLFLNEEEMGGLLTLADQGTVRAPAWRDLSIRDRALLEFAFVTGLRASDLVRVKLDQVLASDGTVLESFRIKMKKTGKTIERVLTPDCKAALEKYLDTRRSKPWPDVSPYLFRPESRNQRRSKGPMNRSSVHRLLKSYLGGMFPPARLHRQSTHVGRRSMAKMIATKAGDDGIQAAAAFLGHEDLRSLMFYLDMDGARNVADKIVSAVNFRRTGNGKTV